MVKRLDANNGDRFPGRVIDFLMPLGLTVTSTSKCVAVPVSELNAHQMIKKLAVKWPFQCNRVCLVELRPGRAPLNLVAAEQLTDTHPTAQAAFKCD